MFFDRWWITTREQIPTRHNWLCSNTPVTLGPFRSPRKSSERISFKSLLKILQISKYSKSPLNPYWKSSKSRKSTKSPLNPYWKSSNCGPYFLIDDWFMLVFDDLWWLMMIYDWCMMIYDWFMIDPPPAGGGIRTRDLVVESRVQDHWAIPVIPGAKNWHWGWWTFLDKNHQFQWFLDFGKVEFENDPGILKCSQNPISWRQWEFVVQ